MNAKTSKKLRKQAEFHPAEERAYVVVTHSNGRKTIRNKSGSPREVYQFLKKNPMRGLNNV